MHGELQKFQIEIDGYSVAGYVTIAVYFWIPLLMGGLPSLVAND